jgi:tetratricopeptide (TPR) repeat protein
MRLAELCERRFNEPERAIGLYNEVLVGSPAHRGAVTALEGLAEREELRDAVAGILEPVYEQTGDAARLAWLRELQLALASTPGERVKLLVDIAHLHEQRLGNPAAGLVALMRAFREDPEASDVVAEMERVAGALRAYEDIAAAAEDVLTGTEIPRDTRRDLHLRVAGWFAAQVADPARAERHYLAALELEPEATAPMDALIDIYARLGRAADLVAMLERRASLEMDLATQKALLFHALEIAERDVGDKQRAAALARKVRSLDEVDARALGELARLGAEAGRWDEVADALRRLADLAAAPAEAVALRLQLAEVLRRRLNRLEDAATALREVLDAEPGHRDALAALEDLFTGAERWMDLQETLARRLEAAVHAGAVHGQVEARLRLAELAERRFQDPDGAIDHLREAAALDPNADAPWDGLFRLLEGLGRWNDLVDACHQRAALPGTDLELAQALRMRAAEVLEARVGDPEGALAAYATLLEAEPRHFGALAAMARLNEKLERWEDAAVALGRAAEAAPGDAEAAALYCKLARLHLAKLANQDAAEASYAQALGRQRHHPEALAELGALYVARNEWSGAAQLRAIALETVQETPARIKGFVEIAALHWEKLHDAGKSAEYLEHAAKLAPTDGALGLLLAERLLAAGRLDEAEARYTELWRAAQSTRKNKDAALYLHQLGRIAESRGDVGAALGKLNDANKLDPTNAALLGDLGRLQYATKDWDGGLKTYRALLLHKLPPGSGVTKGEVYYMLGLVRLELKEESKALNMFERGLESEPGHAEMRKHYDALKARGVK